VGEMGVEVALASSHVDRSANLDWLVTRELRLISDLE
jgi:hypothetical protein